MSRKRNILAIHRNIAKHNARDMIRGMRRPKQTVDLSSATAAELRELAARLNISAPAKIRKADLIRLIGPVEAVAK